MICKRCKSATAIISLPSHNTGFCENCFRDFFSAQVARGIETGKLFTHEDRILVALSGGKDSLSLMLELSRQGYDVTGLHIDLGIPGTSEIVRGVIERFCGRHGFKLIVKEMAREGLAIPLVKQRLKRPVCSACGKIKRHYFNKTALEEGFTALATGHNLDDEIARLFSNTLRWDVGYLSDQGPRLDGEDGFARKVKPFWRLTEFETATYAFLEEIEHHHTPCPYSAGASFTYYKGLWNQLEEEMPGRKLSFYVDFLKRGRSAFAGLEKAEGDALAPCTVCGYPTSSGVCGVCRIREAITDGMELGLGGGGALSGERAPPPPKPSSSPQRLLTLSNPSFPVLRKMKAGARNRVSLSCLGKMKGGARNRISSFGEIKAGARHRTPLSNFRKMKGRGADRVRKDIVKADRFRGAGCGHPAGAV